jgi:hypothetical protein
MKITFRKDSNEIARALTQLQVLTYYRVIDYFDIASEFWKFLWQGMKLYFGFLRYPGHTMAEIFKPNEKYLCNARTHTTNKIKKCYHVQSRGFPSATVTQLLYATKIFVANKSLCLESPSRNTPATSLHKLHFSAAIPMKDWDGHDDTKHGPAAFDLHNHPSMTISPSFFNSTFDDIFDAYPKLDGQTIV